MIDGWHFGMLMAMAPVLVSKHFGKRYCAQNFGAIACFGFISGIIGSQITGNIVDRFQSYQYAYLLCVVYLAISVLLAVKLPRNEIRE